MAHGPASLIASAARARDFALYRCHARARGARGLSRPFALPSISGGLFGQVAPFDGDAAVTFFVISGFVIAHATARKERNAADYFISRAARIYSVAVPAIALTLACDLIGRWIDPGYTSWSYSAGMCFEQRRETWRRCFAALLRRTYRDPAALQPAQ